MDDSQGPAPRSRFVPLLDAHPIVEQLLPRNSISLLVGASRSGKTCLLLPACADYLTTGVFLGYSAPEDNQGQVQQARLGYLACNRTLHEIARDIHESNLEALNPHNFPIESYQSAINRDMEFPSIRDLYSLYQEPRPQFLIVEDIQVLVTSGKISDYQEVTRFLGALKRFCVEQDVTILGTTLTAKVKGDESYADWDRPLGSSAWASGASSLLVLDSMDGGMRQLTIHVRQQATQTRYYEFDSTGKLVPGICLEDWRDTLTARLRAVPEGIPLERRAILEWGLAAGTSPRSCDDWITSCLGEGMLQRVKKGTYRRPYKT